MKYLITIILTSFLLPSCTTTDTSELNDTIDEKVTSKTNYFSTDAVLRGWSDKQGCLHGYGNCAIAITKDISPSEGLFSIKLELLSSNKMLLTYTGDEKNEDDSDILKVNQNITILDKVANELGYSTITVNSGEYKIERSEYPKGQVILDIITK